MLNRVFKCLCTLQTLSSGIYWHPMLKRILQTSDVSQLVTLRSKTLETAVLKVCLFKYTAVKDMSCVTEAIYIYIYIYIAYTLTYACMLAIKTNLNKNIKIYALCPYTYFAKDKINNNRNTRRYTTDSCL